MSSHGLFTGSRKVSFRVTLATRTYIIVQYVPRYLLASYSLQWSYRESCTGLRKNAQYGWIHKIFVMARIADRADPDPDIVYIIFYHSTALQLTGVDTCEVLCQVPERSRVRQRVLSRRTVQMSSGCCWTITYIKPAKYNWDTQHQLLNTFNPELS